VTERATLTIEETARKLGISRNLAYSEARAGGIPAVRLGRRWVVPRARLERELLGEHAEQSRGGPEGAA
jgi:excisionase family DNA binding protein